MSKSSRSDASPGLASLYATQQSMLFLVLAPAVIASLIVLVPASIAGLILIIPGLSGLAGLIGLTMAWLGLAAPGVGARRGGTIVFLLFASLPAIIFGCSVLLVDTSGRPSHAVDPMMAVGPASVAFAVLAVFFFIGIVAWDPAAAGGVASYARRWKVAGMVVAFMTLPLPLGCALAAGGYGTTIRFEQASQASALSERAVAAVDAYRLAHGGAFPPDNASAGLPAPSQMRDTYVASVSVGESQITLKYRDNAFSRFLGAGASDVQLVFRPADTAKSGHWSCVMYGFRLERDVPLMLDGRCMNVGGISHS